MRAIGFINSNDEIIAGDTVLVIEGDVIDRGDYSLELFEYIRNLQRTAEETKEEHRSEVIRHIGNHEEMLYCGMEGDDK